MDPAYGDLISGKNWFELKRMTRDCFQRDANVEKSEIETGGCQGFSL